MTDALPVESVAAQNHRALRTLTRAVVLSEAQFSLILVRCNYATLRQQMAERLRQQCSVNLREIMLSEADRTLYTVIQHELGEESPAAVMVFGLEEVHDINTVITSTNQVREEFRKNFPFPLILWVNDTILKKLVRLAPDFESWATVVEFTVDPDDLLQFLWQTANEVFDTVLALGAGKFVDTATLHLEVGSPGRSELESAIHELHRRNIDLDSELNASLEFVLGQDVDRPMAETWRLYRRSLAFWQQTQNLERQGCLLFSLGIWWRTYSIRRHARYVRACQRAKHYFQQCLTVFRQANRPDLVAKFITSLGEVLQKLEQWDELEQVAEEALALHEAAYPDLVRRAYDHGLLSEVALARSQWQLAQQHAEMALESLRNASWVAVIKAASDEDTHLGRAKQYHRSWYLLLLAKAQQQLGNPKTAIKRLETARREGRPEHDPILYSRILETLRSLYYAQGEYFNAFEAKQEQRSIEQQYGLRAFIGAGRLRPKRQVINPSLVPIEPAKGVIQASAAIAQEITASGRETEVNQLIARISSTQHKLIVLYGQSGVGKSSLVNAGLVPSLEQLTITARCVTPVVLRAYTDWIKTLGQCLSAAVTATSAAIKIFPPPSTTKAILEQLRRNNERNLLTMLVFDQFEEFFFICRDRTKRQQFFEFLRDCLNIPFVKVMLSLREDYLHLLLECSRYTKLEVINNNILDKDILYHLGNFSPEQATALIQSLTARSQLYLEPALVEELVQELAGDLGEVRPIELQVVGDQLQTEKIRTLADYRQFGSKAELVQRYLAEVVADCGPPNGRTARLVLYLLTDENNTRPCKTQAEIAADLEAQPERLDLVLEIFVLSGLVSVLRETPADRYQLIHDYLVLFIRQEKEAELIAELQQERQKRQLTEEALSQVEAAKQLKEAALQRTEESLRLEEESKRAAEAALRREEESTRILIEANQEADRRIRQGWIVLTALSAVAALMMIAAGVLLWQVSIQRKRAENAEFQSLQTTAENLFTYHDELSALMKGVEAGQQLKRSRQASDAWLPFALVLQQLVYGIHEANRLEGHQNWVTSVSFSPDGQTIATASWDHTVRLWQRNGTPVRTLNGHSAAVSSVRFSPDGQVIASAGDDRILQLWRPDGTPIRSILNSSPISEVTFSPDGKMLATANQDGTITLWTLTGQRLQILKGHSKEVLGVSFSPDGQTIASASADRTVKLWSQMGQLLKTFQGHQGDVSSVSFSPDGKLIASASKELGQILLWNRDGQLFRTIKGHYGGILYVRFSPDGKTIASASDDTTVNLWDLNGHLLERLEGHGNRVSEVSFSPDGKTLASSSFDETVKLWRLDAGAPIQLQGTSASYSPDGQILATADRSGTVSLWRQDGTLLRSFPAAKESIQSLSFSPDGQILATASGDDSEGGTGSHHTVKLWSLQGQLLGSLQGHGDEIRSIHFSSDGQTIPSELRGPLIATASGDKTVKLWSREGKLRSTLQGHEDGINSVRFSPDGETIATASGDKTVKLWSREGKLLTTLKGHMQAVMTASFSPDGKTIATASDDKTIRLWKSTGELIATIQDEESVSAARFSSDGQVIVSANGSGAIQLWSLSGKRLYTLKGHHDSVLDVGVRSDGQAMLSVGLDNQVKVWNLDLDDLRRRSCDWLNDYLASNRSLNDRDRYLCNPGFNQSSVND
ncbi:MULTISPECIES: hypothetical protein [Trichocoleus]|uniref:Novel STAND NTPase 1 domain-containing protein n=1 Tax=Trichocoleus desertorum GB2-A4 TaxID=2933944 RepID=A0ABV0JFA0_9CYAN|nr:hypothetical protein [Trichocoleus sp. FACHB-46]MBD1865171.1 hypothetical protein [Trichocoleus sp. FACHB-46]